MEPIYRKEYKIEEALTGRTGYLSPAGLLSLSQDIATEHCNRIGADLNHPGREHLLWAIIRQRVQILKMPRAGEIITLETWPVTTTRVAYPRATRAFDREGQELFRVMSLWVLMDRQSRGMVLPGKSGVEVNGVTRGIELPTPGSLAATAHPNNTVYTVCAEDLDENGHANNTRYLAWIGELLKGTAAEGDPVKELTICYLNESKEGDELDMGWELTEAGILQVDASRRDTLAGGKESRIFSAQLVLSTAEMSG